MKFIKEREKMFSLLDVWWSKWWIEVEILNFASSWNEDRCYSALAFCTDGSYLEVLGFRLINKEK